MDVHYLLFGHLSRYRLILENILNAPPVEISESLKVFIEAGMYFDFCSYHQLKSSFTNLSIYLREVCTSKALSFDVKTMQSLVLL